MRGPRRRKRSQELQSGSRNSRRLCSRTTTTSLNSTICRWRRQNSPISRCASSSYCATHATSHQVERRPTSSHGYSKRQSERRRKPIQKNRPCIIACSPLHPFPCTYDENALTTLGFFLSSFLQTSCSARISPSSSFLLLSSFSSSSHHVPVRPQLVAPTPTKQPPGISRSTHRPRQPFDAHTTRTACDGATHASAGRVATCNCAARHVVGRDARDAPIVEVKRKCERVSEFKHLVQSAHPQFQSSRLEFVL